MADDRNGKVWGEGHVRCLRQREAPPEKLQPDRDSGYESLEQIAPEDHATI